MESSYLMLKFGDVVRTQTHARVHKLQHNQTHKILSKYILKRQKRQQENIFRLLAQINQSLLT